MRTLADAEDIELVTRGRRTGRDHSVRVRFAYADGVVWVRTGERPPDPASAGVRRRSAAERTPDWLRNLQRDPRARLRAGVFELPATYEPSADREADLRRMVELHRDKYGVEWVGDWYMDMGRIPVKLRLDPAALRAGSTMGE